MSSRRVVVVFPFFGCFFSTSAASLAILRSLVSSIALSLLSPELLVRRSSSTHTFTFTLYLADSPKTACQRPNPHTGHILYSIDRAGRARGQCSVSAWADIHVQMHLRARRPSLVFGVAFVATGCCVLGLWCRLCLSLTQHPPRATARDDASETDTNLHREEASERTPELVE